MDTIRSSIIAEQENLLKLERTSWEEKLKEVERLHREELERVKSKGKNRDTAEQQIMFNEALKKAVDEKDNAVKALEEKSKLFNDEVSKHS